MTPAKLYALLQRRREWLGLIEAPTAQVSSLIYNSHRRPANKETGESEAPVLGLEHFQLYRNKAKSLAAKDDRDYTLLGAEADASAWKAYTKGKQEHNKQQGGKDNGRIHK